MNTSHYEPRHRAGRVSERARQRSASQGGRRSVVAVAATGLVASLVSAAPAGAQTQALETQSPVATHTSATQVVAVADRARSALSATSAVKVSADAAWSASTTTVSLTAAPPPPEPEPEPVVQTRTTAAATRSTVRTEPATTTAAAPAVEQTATAAPAAVDSSSVGGQIVSIAQQYLGIPYVYGGSSPSTGFDCSGFTQYVFAQIGVSLPRTDAGQSGAGRVVSAAEAQPGDLVWTPGHVAIYMGNGMIIHSPRPGKTVSIVPMYQSNPTFIRVVG